MIKIALCDDEENICGELLALLERYRGGRGTEPAARTFRSPLELLDAMERGARFDVLILDILMPGLNGIDAAAEIRRYDSSVKIIFLTSSSEYAVESYTVNAYYYLLKPVTEDKLFPLLDSVRKTFEREQTSSIVLRCKDGITRVETKRIEFCEVFHRTLLIHLTSGEILESTGSLDKLEEELSFYSCFIRAHRSYLINLDHVRSITNKTVVMAHMSQIPIPRAKYNEIKNAFLENAFQEGTADL